MTSNFLLLCILSTVFFANGEAARDINDVYRTFIRKFKILEVDISLLRDEMSETMNKLKDLEDKIVKFNEKPKQDIAAVPSEDELEELGPWEPNLPASPESEEQRKRMFTMVRAALRDEKTHLRKMYTEFDARIRKFEDGTGDFRHENNPAGQNIASENLTVIVDGLVASRKDFSKEIQMLKVNHGDIASRMTSLEKRSSSSVAVYNNGTGKPQVSFTARLVTHRLGVGKLVKIAYGGVIYNDGNGYNPTTGDFTCPVSGVYLFTYFLQGLVPSSVETRSDFDAKDYGAHLFLIHQRGSSNMTVQSEAISEPHINTQSLQGGNSVVLRVEKGEKVFLATSNAKETHYLIAYRSTFTGILLY